MAIELKPARPSGGQLCSNKEMHSAHGACPGLRPANWVQQACMQCHNITWVPPDMPADAVPICSATCAHAFIMRLK